MATLIPPSGELKTVAPPTSRAAARDLVREANGNRNSPVSALKDSEGSVWYFQTLGARNENVERYNWEVPAYGHALVVSAAEASGFPAME